MKTFLLLLLSPFFSSCGPGVFYGEMPVKPVLTINENVLSIKTTNSIKNSAQLIYKVYIVSVNQNKKIVYMAANQSIGMPYRDIFRINLDYYKMLNPETYQYYWCDPDQKMTKMTVSLQK